MIVLGITGQKGSGKTEVRKYLERTYGFTTVPMADPMKGMLASIGLTQAQLNGDEKEVPCPLLGGATPRHAMQTLGTEWGRMMVCETLWTEIWGRRVSGMKCPVVADDVRFENEFMAVRALGGKILRVARPGLSDGDQHPSETMARSLDADYGISNHGNNLVALHRSVDQALHILKLGR